MKKVFLKNVNRTHTVTKEIEYVSME